MVIQKRERGDGAWFGEWRERLRAFHEKHRRGPSYQELAKLAGFASKQAAFRLAHKLVEAGVLQRDATGRLSLGLRLSGVPLLGAVQAGFPTPAEEDVADLMNLNDYLIRSPTATFLLRVNGDSMIDAGILPGDLVVVERGRTPQHGAIVLAEVDGEWTLKYLHKQGKSVQLVAANTRYPPIRAQRELKIAGVVHGVVRRY